MKNVLVNMRLEKEALKKYFGSYVVRKGDSESRR
jgi:hypothetical protein